MAFMDLAVASHRFSAFVIAECDVAMPPRWGSRRVVTIVPGLTAWAGAMPPRWGSKAPASRL